MKTAKEIRSSFLSFFAEKGHRIVPSAPVVPHGDPTLLFTNAGMNQFKDVFLGTGTREYSRAADTQKCVRVSGKHNDLEEVGVDTYHHTFFEMLGNWSFGDYFKREAIAWAWEFLVDRMGIDSSRIYATVFGGDEADNLQADAESERLWPELTPLPKERVLRFGRKANFWEMGDTGPCGPCTEIHYDRGVGTCDKQHVKGHVCEVNSGCARFLELWNLVFIEFNRGDDGRLAPLPAKHVDTGMGFERITAVLQGKTSNYDTDLFTPIFRRVESLTGKRYGATMSPVDIAFRVIADHIRALSAAFADGALPSNEGRGYVLRRILRRAARFGRQALEQRQPFLYQVVPAVVEIFGDTFPEIAARKDHIALLIESEEKAFAQTLDRGLDLYAGLASKVRASKATVIPGGEAFDLYATFGFPRDLVELMAREDGLEVDAAGWNRAAEAHKQASKGGDMFAHAFNPSELEGVPATKTVFYRDDDGQTGGGTGAKSTILKMIGTSHLVLDRTPFYAESGGQVGDAGMIEGEGFRYRVDDTQRHGDVVVHSGELLEGDLRRLPKSVDARVDIERRRAVMRNHTGTHLLHWALRSVLGNHATQQGSLVAPEKLRFDVTHPRAITLDEIEKIEALVNGKVVENATLGTTLEDLNAAKARGVIALFGEKYSDRVRVVDIGGYSTELCGGTHCAGTGDIGAFVIVSESAVQAGVRRIEAVTGLEALRRLQQDRRLLREAAAALKAKQEEIPARIGALQEQVKELKKSGGKSAAADAVSVAKKLIDEAARIGGVAMIVAEVGIPAKDLAAVADLLRNGATPCCGVLAAPNDGKVGLVAFASKDVAKKVHAGNVVKSVAQAMGGGGGGRPDFAQAGGNEPEKLGTALELARSSLERALA